MFNQKGLLALLTITLLSACSVTQPKAPLVNGLESAKKDGQKVKKTYQEPKYTMVRETVEVKHKVYHTVKPGDRIWALGRKYKVDPRKIIKQNHLKNPNVLNTGDKLYIKTEVKKKVVHKKQLVKVHQTLREQTKPYSLTRNPKLYNQNTPEFRKQISIPRQDVTKTNKNKNLDFGYHKVKRGENLFRIGKKYGVSVFDLMAYNDLGSPQDLKAGFKLKIPVAKKEFKAKESVVVASKKVTSKDTTLNFDKIDKNLAKKKGFIYPVNGRIISKFGKQGHGIRNDGIDLAVKMGTPVRASQKGTVMYSESVSTLGNMVLIKHSYGYISAYTHNSKLLVKKGSKVAKGQVIALSGDSGNAKQPMLHFELRRYGKAVNPTRLLK
ncbi:MAG TPA: hypothetical protein DCL21_06015 [Alphaproteobacteria bacterium]|nr:hypothetical protein [Alphaproteobacteria bacterium]